MKTEQGVIRFDRMNEFAWCFDMDYQVIYLELGMVLSIKLQNRFQQCEIFELTDNTMSVETKHGRWSQKYQINQGERFPARMSADTIDEIIIRAELQYEEAHCKTSEKLDEENEISDLPF